MTTPQPSPDVSLQLKLSRPYLPAGGKPDTLHLVCRATLAASATVARVPLNLALVLDSSPSMFSPRHKIETVLVAVQALLPLCGPDDVLSVVSFDEHAHLLVPPGRVPSPSAFREMLGRITAGNWTVMAQGMAEASRQLAVKASPGRLTCMLLLTDGQTQGKPSDCVGLAKELAARGGTVTCLGIGSDFDHELLTDVANAGNGRSYYLKAPLQLKQIFEAEFRRLASVALTDVTFVFEGAGGVKTLEAWRGHPDFQPAGKPLVRPETKVSVPVGNLEQGGTCGAYFALQTPGGLRPGPVDLGRLGLTYKLVGPGGGSGRVDKKVTVECVPDGSLTAITDPFAMGIADRAHAFRLQEQGLAKAKTGRHSEAAGALEECGALLQRLGDQDGAKVVLTEAVNLRRQTGISEAGTKAIYYRMRDPGK